MWSGRKNKTKTRRRKTRIFLFMMLSSVHPVGTWGEIALCLLALAVDPHTQPPTTHSPILQGFSAPSFFFGLLQPFFVFLSPRPAHSSHSFFFLHCPRSSI